MADVSSLGEYKVVVTADYSQLKTQFQAMADYVTKTTKSMTDSVNKSMDSMNATMIKQLQASVDQLKRSFEGLGDAPKKSGDGFKSYAAQLREAQKEAEKIHQKIEKLKADMASGVNADVANPATLKSLQQEFENARLKVDRLKDAQLDFKNRVDQTALAAKEMDKALAQAAKDEQNLMKQNAKLLEGEMRSRQKLSEATKAQAEAVKQVAKEQANVVKQLSGSAGNTGYGDYARRVREEAKAEADFRKQQGQAILAAEERVIAGRTAAHKAFWQEQVRQEQALERQRQAGQNQQNQRIRQLQTQYKVAYEEVNKYLQSHAKMSEAVFIRLQGRLTAIGNEIRSMGATPAMRNPLEGMDYEQHIGAWGRLSDAIKSVKHHLTWMASAVAIGGIIGIPVAVSKAIESFDALNTKIMQNMELANRYEGNTARLHSDMNKMGEAARTMAQGYGLSVNEVQEGMQIITRRFKDADTAIYLTNVALQMSKLDMVDVKQSAKDLEAVMLQFGMGAKDAGKFLNDFSVICHVARISGTDMLMALERSGSAFKAMNMDARAAMAAIAAVSTVTGKSGSTIGDSWKSILANMDFKKATQALDEYNIKLYDVQQNGTKTMRNGTAVLADILRQFQELDDEGRRKLATAIAGGKYQVNNMMAFLADASGSFNTFLNQMNEKSSDAMTAQLLAASMDTYETRLGQAKAAFENLGVIIGSMVLPHLKNFALLMTGIGLYLQEHAQGILGVAEMLGKLALAFIAVKGAMMIWAGATAIYTAIQGAIKGVTLAELAHTAVMTIKNGLFMIGVPLILAYNAFMAETGVAAGIAAAGQVLLNTALAAFEALLAPIGVAVLATIAIIAALGVVAYEVYENWETVSNDLTYLWNTLVEVVSVAVEAMILAFSPFIVAIYALVQVVEWAIKEVIAPIFQWVAEVIHAVLSSIGGWLREHGITVQNVSNFISDIWRNFVQWLANSISPAFAQWLNDMVEKLASFAKKVWEIASSVKNAIRSMFGIAQSAGENGGGWIDSIASGIKNKLNFDLLDTIAKAKAGMENAPYAEAHDLPLGTTPNAIGGGGGAGSKGKGSKGAKGAKEADNSPEAMGYRYLVGKGLDKNMVLGLLGNIMQESGFNPDADNGSHRGLIQWDYNDANRTGRWYDFMDDYLANLRGISEEQYNAMDVQQKRALQYDFAIYEMRQGNEQEAYRRILSAAPTTPEQWASLINQHYERSGEAPGSPVDWQRQNNAREYANRFERKNGEDNYTDGEKAIKASYKEAKTLFDLELERLKTERQREGQKVSAREELQLYEKMMGIGNGKNPFAVLEEAQKDYAKKLTEYAKEEAKRAEYAQKATNAQVAAIDKMADAEVAFAEKLGLMSKSDVRDYYTRKNERNYATQKPILDAKLASTVALDRGTAEDMMAAYQGLIYAKDRAEAEWYAKKLMWLSRDVDATKKALDEEMKLEEAYQNKKQELEREAYEYKARYTIGFVDSVTSNFQSNLEAMLNGTKSFGDGIRDMFKGIINEIIKMFTEDLSKRLKGWLAKALHLTGDEKPLGANPDGYLGSLISGGTKKEKGTSGDFGSLFFGLAGGKDGSSKGGVFGNFSILDSLIPKNTMKIVQKQMNQLGNMMKTSFNGTYTALTGISRNGLQNISNNMQVSTDSMGAIWQSYTDQKVITNEVGDNAIVAQTQTTAATVQATTATMMSWLMLVLGLFALFGGSRKSKTTTTTSSENLGRAPDTYYMTPTPVLQSTNYSVPSMDIGGNIEQDMLIFAHKNEMVLTPEQADVIRNTAKASGSIGGGSDANANVKSNITVSTVDSRGFDRVLRNYNRDLSKQVKKGIRNGYLTGKGLL